MEADLMPGHAFTLVCQPKCSTTSAHPLHTTEAQNWASGSFLDINGVSDILIPSLNIDARTHL